MHIIEKIRLFSQWFILLAIIFVAVIINFIFGVTTMRNSENWMSHTHEVRTAISDTKSKYTEADNLGRLYLVDRSVRPRLDQSRNAVINNINQLRSLTSDNIEQQENINNLQAAILERFANQEQQAIELKVQNGKLISDVSSTIKSINAQDKVNKTFDIVNTAEGMLLQTRFNTLRVNQWMVVYIFGMLILLSIPTGIFLFLSTIKSLKRNLNTSESLRHEIINNTEGRVVSMDKDRVEKLISQIENIGTI